VSSLINRVNHLAAFARICSAFFVHTKGLALWTANERLKEARATGAAALVTACPWCERNFKDAVKEYGKDIEIYDIAEIAYRAL